jgi:DNA-binding NarL/FixJ family response regulator
MRRKAMQNRIDAPRVAITASTKVKQKIVIVDDHALLRAGLRSLLSCRDEFEVVGEAGDGLEAIKCVSRLNPDLVLIDLSMPRMNGCTSIREIKRKSPRIKVLALTVHKDEDYIREAFNAGADGYCLKDARRDELIMAITSIISGMKYIGQGISERLLRGYLEGRIGSREAGSSFGSLTHREKEILKLIGEGHRNKEISGYLFISIKTVEKHRSNVMQKLNLHNVSSLTAYAMRKGLVTK